MEKSKEYLDKLTYNVVGAAIEVHRILGPGLLEKVYQKCLARELYLRNIKFKELIKIPFDYKGEFVDLDLVFDFFIEDILVVEIKAVQEVIPLFHAQTLAYMKLLKAPKGILINFNSINIFHHGQKTFVNEHYEMLPD
ncbi:GxxExxY protein [Aquiflexum lacus]|uniref:GxxExxY protein n=1 Tax=Aquiflexum lacus TaxID=2483805 RepID=UPI001893ADA7|nr:GxxExxY protein [Aquiflexum lacus]